MSEHACDDARLWILDQLRGTLPANQARTLAEHLASCPACTRAAEEERTLTELLRTRLPAKPAPDALRRALEERITRSLDTAPVALPRTAATAGRRRPLLASLWSLSLAAAVALGFWAHDPRSGGTPMLREALNDHLRVLYAQSPVEVPNGGLHQVKPWFTGRVDFAPDITFAGDDDFPLVGGAVSYFVDRKAASFVFKRRLHTISLHVFRGDGVDWPRAETRAVGAARVQLATLDGFHLVFWQAQGLGHVLVSDVSQDELLGLTAKLLPR